MDLSGYFGKISEELKTLIQDVKTYKVVKDRASAKNQTASSTSFSQTDMEVHDHGNTVEVSFKSVMPRTVLRKSVEEVEEANANPQYAMFIDKFKRIFE